MGLGNGIYLSRNKVAEKYFPGSFDDEDVYELHFAYWRKCYGIRDRIVDVLEMEDNTTRRIDVYELVAIIDFLSSIGEHTWDNYESIWTWEEYHTHHCDTINSLLTLARIMAEHEDEEFEVYFYDSY